MESLNLKRETLNLETLKLLKLERTYLYKFFSLLFMYPTEQTLFQISNLNSKPLNPETFKLLNSLTLQEWQNLYVQTFGHIAADIPLYESNYFPDNVFKESQRLADIGAFYKAFGVKIAQNTKEKLDHISLELEFMSYLLSKEIYATDNDNVEAQEICIDAQKKFFIEHLGKWAPKFCERLQKHSHNALYTTTATFFQSFIKQETEINYPSYT